MANWKWCAALLAACGGLAGLAARPEGEMVRRLNAEVTTIVQRAIENYRVLDAAATPMMRVAGGRRFAPHGYNRATKKLDMRPISWWTSGYFPGALQLLGQWTDDTRVKYRDFAVKQLLALASPDYFAPSGELGGFLLRHGVGHKPGGLEIDTPLDYGDYYFLEALHRFSLQVERTFRIRADGQGDK